MSISELPNVPSRSNPTTFASDMDGFLAAFVRLRNEINALEATWVLSNITGTSVTPLSIGTGPKILTTQAGKAFQPGQFVFLINSAATANLMHGTVTSYNSATGDLVVNVLGTMGGGTGVTTWSIVPAPPTIAAALSGGSAGRIPYQSATDTTAFMPAGAVGQLLSSGGVGPPAWVDPSTLAVNSADKATSAGSAAVAIKLETASGAAPSYSARAFVNFSGSTGAIRSSGNVSSVTRNSVGDYSINLTTPMPDDKYVMTATARNDIGPGGICVQMHQTVASTPGACRVEVIVAFTNARVDLVNISAAFFR